MVIKPTISAWAIWCRDGIGSAMGRALTLTLATVGSIAGGGTTRYRGGTRPVMVAVGAVIVPMITGGIGVIAMNAMGGMIGVVAIKLAT